MYASFSFPIFFFLSNLTFWKHGSTEKTADHTNPDSFNCWLQQKAKFISVLILCFITP